MRFEAGDLIGPYEILEALGAGGMGEVYRAVDSRLDREIALKILPPVLADDQEALQRFRREAKSLASLNHPHIVGIYSVEEIDDLQVITMELVEGETLDSLIPEAGMSTDRFLELAIPLTEALAAAHDQDIVHRDLKPANIMVTGDGKLKILDFGLAKKTTATADDPTMKLLTREGTIVGTAPYMSPEQIEGRSAHAQSDIFSVGIIFFEMLTGHRPFGGSSLISVASSILKDEPESIEMTRPDVPPAIVRVLQRALAKAPDDRYASLEEMLRDLELSQTEKAVSADVSPPARSDRPATWKSTTLIVAATAALFVLIAAWLWGNRSGDNELEPLVTPTSRIDSLAVLPFANLSGDEDQDFFAEGFTEALINDLAKLEGLKVISRTSVMRYRDREASLPEIAQELNVRGIIEGSVMRSGNQVRINAQLIDAASDRTVWADDYQDRINDVLSLQSRIARAIAEQVAVTLSPEQEARLAPSREVDPNAYEAYLRGRAAWSSPGGIQEEKTIAYFREALRIDPDYALAHAGLADAYLTIAHFDRPPHEAMPLAREQALKALELDPSLAQAHAAYADAVFHYDWDWELAEREFRKAIELNPGYAVAHWWYSGLLAALGRHEEAAREIEIAQELDPMSSPLRGFALRIHYWAREPERLAKTAQRMAEHDEQIDMGAVMGAAIFARAIRNEVIPPEQIEELRAELDQRPIAAVELAAVERSAESRAALVRLEEIYERRYISAYMIAIGWVFLGEHGRALDWLERARDDRAADLIWINVEPAFDVLREDPRFMAILEEMKFPEV